MSFWEFLNDSPFIALCVVGSIYYTIKHLTFVLPNRYIRHLNISKNGWPPKHLDADGDFKEKESEND